MARRLHIGGIVAAPGWEVFNILKGPNVDHIGNAKDLSRFPDNSFNDIYASHILEHFDYNDEVLSALMEWHRVLKPFGRVFISVPDLDVLARLFIKKDQMTINDRIFVMCMMFGGHLHEHDYHFAGLNEEFLRNYLAKAGFGNIQKVEEFGIFQDASSMRFKGELVSLNVVAKKLENNDS